VLDDETKDGDGNLIEEMHTGYYSYLTGVYALNLAYLTTGKTAVEAGQTYTLTVGENTGQVMLVRWKDGDYVGYDMVEIGDITIPDDCDTIAINMRTGTSILAKYKDITEVDPDDAATATFVKKEASE